MSGESDRGNKRGAVDYRPWPLHRHLTVEMTATNLLVLVEIKVCSGLPYNKEQLVYVSHFAVMSMYIESASQMWKRTTKAVRTDPGKKKAMSSSSTELAQGQLWVSRCG